MVPFGTTLGCFENRPLIIKKDLCTFVCCTFTDNAIEMFTLTCWVIFLSTDNKVSLRAGQYFNINMYRDIYFFNNGDMIFKHISDIHYQCFPYID